MSFALVVALSLIAADDDVAAAPASTAVVAPVVEAAPVAEEAPKVKTVMAADADALAKGAARARGDDDPHRKVPVVLLDLRADGVEPTLASAVSSVVGSELHDLGVLQVTTEEDVRRMMDFDQMKLILACQDEAKCLSSFGNALGAEMLVTGSVGKAGNDVVVGLVLTDLSLAVPTGREVATIKTPSGLVSEVRLAIARLLRPVLAKRGGTLVVLGNEGGATVMLDGAAIGVTPFRRDNVPSGPHRIEAVKDGFMKGTVDITVQPQQTAAVDMLLIPSRELSDTHKRNNNILRIVSAGTAGLGVAAIATGAGVWWLQYDKLNNTETGYVAQYAKDPGGAILLPTTKYNEISTLRLTSYLIAGSSVPLFVAGAVLFSISEDPNKYDPLLIGE
ncbi:MAG: PEGA domain-containing protein [Deltaproteobacteria bacterium]|nr:PEGA domain-containing protein [Deltaproteobacteria bacterium]